MAKYLITASYTAVGLRGLQKESASGRRQAVASALEAVGGKLECMYYSLGEDDVVVIAEAPDHVKAAAFSIAVSATGLARARTTALLTVEEADRALTQAVNYRPPGA